MNHNILNGAIKYARDKMHMRSLADAYQSKFLNRGAFRQRGGVTNGSQIRRTEGRIQLDGVLAAAGGQQMRIPLNKQSLVEETVVRIQASQTYATLPTGNTDIRRFITSLSIESSDGRRKFMTGYQAYDFGRYTQNGDNPSIQITASPCTADFEFVLHHSNDQSLYDAMAFINASKLNTFDLVIQFAPDTQNGFTGTAGAGVTPGITAYTTTVRNVNYPGMLYDSSGNLNTFVESLRHVNETQTVTGAAGGGTTAPVVRLTAGNKTRFISIHTFDTTNANVPGGIPSDAVMSNIRLNINGQERRVTDYLTQKRMNSGDRQFFTTGCAILDFGDDEAGFLDLRGVAEPYLSWDVANTPPANWRADFGQDFSLVMK